jgi:hypothetical protein
MTVVTRYSAWVSLAWRPPDYATNSQRILFPVEPILDLTEARCLALGATVPRAGSIWSAEIGFYRGDVDGVLTAIPLGIGGSDGPPAVADAPAVVSMTLYDPVTAVKEAAITITPDAPTLHVYPGTGTFSLPTTLDPGRYGVTIQITWPAIAPAIVGVPWIHCGGRLDVLPKVPV